jgi:methylmalonyl-CoA mutase, C-terminal domain
MNSRIRILAAKPGLDGHDRGIKVICHGLRDAGMEVVYTGLRQTPEQIVAAALQEGADVIALSILSGAHDFLLPKVAGLLKERQIDNILLIAGGIIPEEDINPLKKQGVSEVFGPGTMIKDIEVYIKNTLSKS